MNLEIITIGTELLLGFTLDTNGAELGRALSAAGIRVVRRTSVADRPGEILSRTPLIEELPVKLVTRASCRVISG